MLTWLRNQMKQGTYQNSAVLPDLSEEEIPQRGVSHSRQFEEQHQTKEDFQMINYISGLVFTILFVIGGAIAWNIYLADPTLAVWFSIVWFVGDVIIAQAIQLA